MAATKTKNDPEGIYDVNMTPLIDISLVLVVILMVAMPMAFQSSIAVRNAAASGRSGAGTRSERVEIAMLSENALLVNRAPVARAELGAALRSRLAASATRQVVVRCADGVSHGAFVGVLDEAKAAGAGQIAVVGK